MYHENINKACTFLFIADNVKLRESFQMMNRINSSRIRNNSKFVCNSEQKF